MDTMPEILEERPSEPGCVRLTASVPHLGEFEFNAHLRPDQYISRDLIAQGIWEPFETEVFRRLCRHGDVVVDLGANIGWYSVIAAKLVGVDGRVFAFEPDPTNFSVLRTNALCSGHAAQIELFNSAVADCAAQSRLFLSPNNLGDHRLFDAGAARECIVAGVTTLDTLFYDSARKPTLVKSDTQGSEARIVQGARKLFSQGWRPVLILEFWPYGLSYSGTDPLQLFEHLISLGYSPYELTEERPRLKPLSQIRLRQRLAGDLSPQSEAYVNLLCLPNDSDRSPLVADLIDLEEP